MALRSRATEARAARAGTTEETPAPTGGGSLAERRRRAVQPRGGTAEPAPAPAPDEAPAPTNAPVEEPAAQADPAVPAAGVNDDPRADEPAPVAKRARKPRSDKGTKRAAVAEVQDGSELSATEIRARMREIETHHKELTKSFERDKKALADEYAALAVRLLDA